MKQYIRKNWEIAVVLTLFMILVIAYFPLINSRITENVGFDANHKSNSRALSDRIFYNNVSRETISHNFITGSGPGTFIFQINGYLKKNGRLLKDSSTLSKQKQHDIIPFSKYATGTKLEPWEYQPVHSIYLLICSEIGIVGFAIFCLIIIEIISNSINIIRKIARTGDF